MKKLFSYFLLVRPVNVLIAFISSIAASIISIDDTYSIQKIIFSATSAAFAIAAGNVINDIFDIAIDKINRPERILPSAKITQRNAGLFYISLVCLSILFSFFINIPAIIIAVTANGLIYLYSYKLKSTSLIGNLTVSFLTGLVFIYGGVAVGNWQGGIVPALFALLINLIREVIKDIEDLEGDKKNNAATFPIKHGVINAIKLINVLIVLLLIATLIPFYIELYSIEYLFVIILFVHTSFIYLLYVLQRDVSKSNLRKISTLIKTNMIFGLIAIYIGS